ncbi:sarcosine oxidase subunit gamma [Phreatobacter stygius]|uniref:Sarcosine oxidase subunit gamma n=1 Tax=Phreatobacter stygius TaxID=1940610 RepID=A0A4D7AW38_9HYPH|nr:sarcosine oxidase subunit gamma family protein [Phreatobacter stygius]QCI65269.1 sarcosine oxidase subunit gamma [Phreatobacter stygius]
MLDQSTLRAGALDHLATGARVIPAAMLDVLPDAAKLVFRGRPPAVATADQAFGLALPREACRFNAKGGRTAFWLGPDEWLLQAAGEDPAVLFDGLGQALLGARHSLVDVSHRSDAFSLSGSKSAYVLNHGCPLDLSAAAFPVGMCTRTLIGKATVMLSRPEPDRFHVDVWRSFAPYVWQLLDEARGELV